MVLEAMNNTQLLDEAEDDLQNSSDPHESRIQ